MEATSSNLVAVSEGIYTGLYPSKAVECKDPVMIKALCDQLSAVRISLSGVQAIRVYRERVFLWYGPLNKVLLALKSLES